MGAIQLVMALVTALPQITSSLRQALPQVLKGIWDAAKQVFADVAPWLSGIWQKVSAWFSKLWQGVINVFNNIKTAISTAFNAIRNIATSIMNGIKTAITNAWNSIKNGVSTAVNAVKSVVTNVWNGIKTATSTAFNAVKSTATNIWNGIKSAITKPIEAARDTIKGIVDKIKGFFSGMKISIPKIKLPHFGITPSGWQIGDLLKGSIPKLGIEWYAKAMNAPRILDAPTVFGYNAKTGELQGGGEAGSELVGGTNTVMGMISAAVASQNSVLVVYLQKIIEILAEYFPQLLEALDIDLLLDGDLLVAGTASKMNKALGKINIGKDRGR
jgi:hypothetical protein